MKEHPFWERPCVALHFRGGSANIGFFELPRTNGSRSAISPSLETVSIQLDGRSEFYAVKRPIALM
jgi:hypothetical protein